MSGLLCLLLARMLALLVLLAWVLLMGLLLAIALLMPGMSPMPGVSPMSGDLLALVGLAISRMLLLLAGMGLSRLGRLPLCRLSLRPMSALAALIWILSLLHADVLFCVMISRKGDGRPGVKLSYFSWF